MLSSKTMYFSYPRLTRLGQNQFSRVVAIRKLMVHEIDGTKLDKYFNY